MLKKAQKKILMISFAFPPIGGSGVQRVLKFAKYLPCFGWEPVILTVDSATFPVKNQVGAEEFENLEIYRTKFIDFLNIRNKIVGAGLVPALRATTRVAPTLNKNQEGQTHRSAPTGLINFLLKMFNQYFLIPDDKIGWIPFAVKKALEIIKSEEIDIIYTTGDPFSTFITGYILKKLTGKKWVVDYRDSWTDYAISDPAYYKGGYRKYIENTLEYHILKNADKIISVSPLINEKLQNKHKKVSKEKYYIVHNGYDPEDFTGIKKSKNEKFTIIHAGVLSKARSPKIFLKSVAELIKENEQIKKNIEVKFIGASLGEDIAKIINGLNLNENVKIIPYLEHKECLKEIANADALLLIQDYINLEAYSGKIFEYLYSGNPILGLVPPLGCAAQLINETKSGIVVGTEQCSVPTINKEDIKQAVKDIHSADFKPDKEIIKKYERRALTGKLAEILDEMICCAG